MMTLRQLINHVMDRGAITHVMSCLHVTYYASDDDFMKIIHSYTATIKEMRELEPGDMLHDHQIVLREVHDENQSHVDVHLVNIQQTFAVDYVDWSQLIDLPVQDQVGLQAHDVLAHVLWELTFHGFTREQVNRNRSELETLCVSTSANL